MVSAKVMFFEDGNLLFSMDDIQENHFDTTFKDIVDAKAETIHSEKVVAMLREKYQGFDKGVPFPLLQHELQVDDDKMVGVCNWIKAELQVRSIDKTNSFVPYELVAEIVESLNVETESKV